MAKWALVTTLLYIFLVAVIFVPLLEIAAFDVSISASFMTYQFWQFWLFVFIVLLIQASLLLFPVKADTDELKPQRKIWIPIITTALLFAVIALGIIWSVIVAIFGDDGINFTMLIPIIFLLCCWIIWSIILFHYIRKNTSVDVGGRFMAWLIRGSILELLVAVPSHIIVRRRDDCCSPGVTFIGITTGAVIMALAFGPGIFFLFKQRFNKMKPKSQRFENPPVQV